MTAPGDDAGRGILERVRTQARERSLRLLDFLEAYYSIRFPPIHDISSYDDVRINRSDLPTAEGVTLTEGGEVWLTADIVDLPPVPRLPPELADWVEGSVIARERPTIRHPDSVARRLIELLDDPPFIDGRSVDLDDLDADQLASLGITGIKPGEVDAAAINANDELLDTVRQLRAWLASTWEPWSVRWLDIERGRVFYKELFDLRTRMEHERDMSECVWGFARLRWKPVVDGRNAVSVDHPLICVPIELTLDQRSGRISVSPAGAPDIESAWTVGLPLSDRAGYNEQRTSAEQVILDPWSPETSTLVRSLLRAIDHDGVLVDGDDAPRLEAHAIVDAEDWALFVRRRQPNFRGFLDDQRHLYSEPGAIVPDPFAALVIDEPSALDSSPDPASPGDPDSGATGDEPGERLLLPLATNHQQMQIVELAQSRAGVTAQGPPGTGKSHTIANLISHYVAHGRRVLVTAAKEQALNVLIDKVPAEIRQLCVPVLGSDAAARSRLQATITTIADAAHQRADRGAISRLEGELDNLEARYAATTNALKASRAAETGTAPGMPAGRNPGEWTPSTAAAWLADNRDHLSGIPDAIGQHVSPPLTAAEFNEFDRLCGALSAGDASGALAVLPDPLSLPTGARLASIRLEAEDLRRLLADIEDRVVDWTRVDAAGPEVLTALAGDLDAWADWHMKIAGTWVAHVLSDAHDPGLLAGWEDFCTGGGTERESVLAASRALAAHTVSLAIEPPGAVPPPEFVKSLTEARSRMAGGKSVGATHRSARRALDSCSIDGRTPVSVAELDLVFDEITRRTYRQRLATRWANIAPRVGGPQVTSDWPVEDQIGDLIVAVQTALGWRPNTWPAFLQHLGAAGISAPVEADGADVAALADRCRTLVRRARLVEITQELEALGARLHFQAGEDNASQLWTQLADAFADCADDRWDRDRAEASRLLTLRPDAIRRKQLRDRIGVVAPLFTDQVVARENVIDSGRYEQAWAWRQLDVWFGALDDGPEPAELQAQLEQLSKDLRRVTSSLVAARAWAAVADGLDDRRRTALNRFTTANAKLGKGTGRYAPMWQAELRNAMNEAKDAVPVWIMPIHTVITSFRPAADPPFDVIIIDEASQVGLLEVIVLGLAKRAIVVGDDQQTSPENVGTLQQEVFDMIDDHLGAIGDRRTRFAPTNSLYDIARQQFPQIVQLREHFRCLPRIIEFSNHQWYNDSIVALRDKPPCPGWQPLGSVFVPGGTRRRSDDTNQAEADAIVALVAELIDDPGYDGMTFGIVTLLGSGQAPLISGLLLDRLGPSTIEERAIRVGDPASFQGDERDVVILSMVVAHDTEGRIGAMNKAADARRINVAASRACNQLWVVHSIGPESLHRDDPRKALLEHCIFPAETTTATASFDKTESQFERDVLRRILDAGYSRVIAQYPVGGYRIDLVVEGPETRLAVECDGDYWHGPDRWDDDRARQTVLERSQWTFERIRGSAFYRDRNAALEPLWARLESLGIPKGDWAGEAPTTLLHREWPGDFAPQPEEPISWVRGMAEAPLDPLARTPPPFPVRSTRPGESFSGGFEGMEQRAPRDPRSPSTAEVRTWASTRGLQVGERGRLHPEVIAAWNEDHPSRPYVV